jgi:thiamine pyrophosphate-dependent acetolactate synthase large subunit-like protein
VPVMTGKRAFLELLKQEGVEILFGNPGTTELPLMDALATENELRYVLALQEAAVVAMADGYAQASGKLTVVNLHVAPGLGNGMGMLYDAQKAGAPILVTAGQHDQGFNVTEPILWADLPTLARPLVKWSTEVHRLADLPRIVHRAAKTALAPPTGPVFLSLPTDILNAEADLELSAPTRIAPRLRGDRDAMYTCQALWTAAHEHVGVIFVILNNSSYRILKQRVHALRGHAAQTDVYVGMELTDPAIDFVALARALGIAAERALTVAEATDLLGKALADGGPMLIEVMLDRAFKPV